MLRQGLFSAVVLFKLCFSADLDILERWFRDEEQEPTTTHALLGSCVGFGYALALLGVEEAVVLLGIDAQNVVGFDFRTYAIHLRNK